MKWAKYRVPWEQNWKLPVKMNNFTSRKNIPRICLETFRNHRQTYPKNYQCPIKHETSTVFGGRTWRSFEKVKNKSYMLWRNAHWSLKDQKIWWNTSPIVQRSLWKKLRSITLIAIFSKVYNVLLLNRLLPKIQKIRRKIRTAFAPQPHRFLQPIESSREYEHRFLRQHYYLQDSPRHSIPLLIGKMLKILLAYGLSWKIVTAIMIPYKITKAVFHSPNGDILLWHCH